MYKYKIFLLEGNYHPAYKQNVDDKFHFYIDPNTLQVISFYKKDNAFIFLKNRANKDKNILHEKNEYSLEDLLN